MPSKTKTIRRPLPTFEQLKAKHPGVNECDLLSAEHHANYLEAQHNNFQASRDSLRDTAALAVGIVAIAENEGNADLSTLARMIQRNAHQALNRLCERQAHTRR